MKKFWYGLFAGVFFLACLIPSVGMLLAGPAPAAANEIPAAKPRLVGFDGKFDPDVLSDLQNYMASGFFGRLQAVTAWDALTAKVFHTSANDDVLIGPDGWLFYGAAADDISGANQMTPRQVWCAARSLWLMQEYVQSRGAQFLFTVPCGKYTLYPEHAPEYVTVAQPGNRELLEAALAEQGVNYVNLYDVFTAVDEELYWRWDSHWHSRGAALAADAILAAAGRETDYFSGPFTPAPGHTGDLYEMLYPTGAAQEEDYAWEPGFTFSYLSQFHSADDPTIETENPGAAGSLLMFRDSSGRSLYPYMAQSFGRAYFSRSNNYRIDYVDRQDATLVVVELAERTLEYLLKYPAVFPAPERDGAAIAGAVETESLLTWEEPDKTLEGYVKLTGTLPEDLAAETAVYVRAGGTVYEAIPGPEGFTAYLPGDTDQDGVQVLAGP